MKKPAKALVRFYPRITIECSGGCKPAWMTSAVAAKIGHKFRNYALYGIGIATPDQIMELQLDADVVDIQPQRNRHSNMI